MTDVRKSAADLTFEIAVKMSQTPLELQAVALQGFIEEIQQQATLEGVKLGLEAAKEHALYVALSYQAGHTEEPDTVKAIEKVVEVISLLKPSFVIAKGE